MHGPSLGGLSMRALVLTLALAASSALAAGPGSATSAADCMSSGDASDDDAWPVAVTLPLNCRGSIETRAVGFDEDWYAFSAQAGDALLVGQYGSPRANTVTLWAPDGSLVDMVARNEQERVTLPQTGAYRLVVEGNAGDYQFHLSRETEVLTGTRLASTGGLTPSIQALVGPSATDSVGLGTDASWVSFTSAATGHETLTADQETYAVEFYDSGRVSLGTCAPQDASSELACAVPAGAASIMVRDAFVTAGPNTWTLSYHH